MSGIRPVIHGPALEEDGLLPLVSRCLSAAGIRFSAILSRLVFRPSYDRPTGTRCRTMTAFPRPAACRPSSARVLSPRHSRHLSGAVTYEASVKGSPHSPARPPGSPGALPRRGPLRTVRATHRGTRLKQAARTLRAEALGSCAGGPAARVGKKRAQGGFGHRRPGRDSRGG